MRRALAWTLVALLLAGCFSHRTEKAADDAPFPEGWLTRETSESDNPGEAPDVTVRLTYAPERAQELAERAWLAFDDAGWDVTVLKHPEKGDGPVSTFLGTKDGGQNDAVQVRCGVNEGDATRAPDAPVPMVCVFTVEGV